MSDTVTVKLIEEAENEVRADVAKFFKERYLEIKANVERARKNLAGAQKSLDEWTYAEAEKVYVSQTEEYGRRRNY